MDRMTRVKICGVTSVDDARLAADLGAWAVGTIFHRPSPRACDPAVAADIGAALHRRCEVVGVFVNEPLDTLAEVADACALTALQLHGDEGPAYCREAARRTGCRVIKAARVRGAETLRALRAFGTDYHLLDAHVPGLRGGTGTTFAWELVRGARTGAPLILSGGITPDNVAAAIAATEPFAVDSASGTESAPGRKDPAKVNALIEAVRAVRAQEPVV